jgi:hypothetical protein
MKSRLSHVVLPVVGVLAAASPWASGQGPVRPLANDYVTVIESPDPESVYCYTPGLARLPSGRLVATMDLGGPGAAKHVGKVEGPGGRSLLLRGKVFTSDDRGKTWTHRTDFPFLHARPFVAGKSLYVLGHAGDLMVVRSDDEGVTWSAAAALTEKEQWHQSACNVHHANGCVYLVMEKRADRGIKTWPVAALAPVLMRGRATDDLTRRENWTFASELVFEDAVDYRELDFFGVPFFAMDPRLPTYPAPRRNMAPIGWLETNVVQIVDPDHYWFDPRGKTFHLLMRAHTGGTGLAAMCKVVEQEDGSMTTVLETVPSGRKIAFLAVPGGQMRFHIVYDEPTRLYWLLSSQAIDSMTRADRLPANRYNLPNNERHRLQLHFSKNCVDWCFAGMVAIAPDAGQGRHYASMVVDGDDLHVLSRSGDDRAKSAHDGNLITFHTVKDFRSLVY